MLEPANQYPIFFSPPPFGERLGLNTAGSLERKLERSGSTSGVSCRSCAAGRRSREFFLRLGTFADCSWFFWGDFGDVVASALWDRSRESSCRVLDLCREDSKEGSTASLSSGYPKNPRKPALPEF